MPWWDAFARFSKTILAPGQSAILRERLLDQLVAIGSADEAAVWAQRNLPAKNTLRAVDAKIVEERFQANLFTVGDGQAPGGTTPVATPDGLVPPVGRPDADASQKASMVARKRSRSGVIRALGKTIRLRDKDHRKFVQLQACLVCGRAPSDPHHLTFTQPRALGHRVSDEFTVPVCRIHHHELHRSGDEAAWWQKLNIDPLPVALSLWQHTHGNAQISEGMTRAQAAKTPDMSAREEQNMGHDPRIDPESAAPKMPTRSRADEGRRRKLARSAVASPVQIAYQAAWKRVLREATATANTKRTQLLRGVRE